jgi:predicted Zn-dependent protease
MARRALDSYDNETALRWFEWSARFWNPSAEIAIGRIRAYRRLRRFDQVRTQLLVAQVAGVSRQKLEREQWITLAQAGQLREVEAKLPTLLGDREVDPRDVCDAFVTGFLLTARPGPALQLVIPWLADYPDDVQAHYLQGQAYAMGRHYAEAEKSLREAHRLAPRRADVALGLAESLLQLQQPQAALPLFEVAANDIALSDQAWLGAAQAARRSGQSDKAQTILKSLLEHAPNLGAGWEELGRTQLDQQHVIEAISSLEKAVVLSPNSLSGRQALARALLANGDQARAKPHLEFVTQAGEAMEQIRLLEDRAELDPKNSSIRFQIAEYYRKYDTPILALAWARSVLLLDQEHARAKKLVQDLTALTKPWQR